MLIVFESRVRWKTVQRHFNHADIRIARGSIDQCISYIKKDGKWSSYEDKAETVIEGSFMEWGEKPQEIAKEINHAELLKMIREGLSNAEIYEINPNYVKEASLLDKIRFDILTHEKGNALRLNLKVTYIFGPTGVGKSKFIWEHFSDNVCVITNYKGNGTFDGLKPTDETLVFEEFRDSINLKEMLCYLDIYPISARSRYSDKMILATRIFIVSNWPLEKQYIEEQITDKESYQAFLRRIHEIMEFKKGQNPFVYSSVDEYFKAKRINTDFKLEKISDECFEKLLMKGQ